MSQSAVDAWKAVRSDSDPLRWMIARANDACTELELIDKGSDGYSGLMKKLEDVEGIIFGGLRVAAVDDRGTVKSVRPKFIRFFLMTSSAGGMKRAKATLIKERAEKLLDGVHSSFDLFDAKELTKDEIQRKLQNSAGAHLPNFYDFEGKEEGDLLGGGGGGGGGGGEEAPPPAAAPPPPAVEASAPPPPPPADDAPPRESGNSDDSHHPTTKSPSEDYASSPAAGEAASSADPPPPPPAAEMEVSAPPQPKPEPVRAAPPDNKPTPVSGGGSQSGQDIQEAYRRVQDDGEEPNFVVAKLFEDDSVGLVSVARGDLETFKNCLKPDEIQFGVFRLRAIDDRGSVKSIRPKYIFFWWVGNAVKPMRRARATGQKGRCEELLDGCHIAVAASDHSEIVQNELEKQLLRSGGAHSPNNYDFSGDKNMQP